MGVLVWLAALCLLLLLFGVSFVMWKSTPDREAESLKYKSVYIYRQECTCTCILWKEQVFCRVFSLLQALISFLYPPFSPLRNHCLSLMTCLLQAVLYDFWGRVSCTLPMFEEEAASTTSSLNNDSNHFQQTDNLFLAGYSLQPDSSANVTGSPDISSEPGTDLGCLGAF